MAKITIPTFEQIATMITHLLHNYAEVARSYWDMFYKTEPEDIELKIFNEEGQEQTIRVPNRAKDFRFIRNGEGTPEGTVTAGKGTIYQDTLNGRLYLKEIGTGSTGWRLIGSDESIIKGTVAPEGNVSGAKGTVYENINTSSLYIKTTEGGNTGWLLVSANTSTLANRDLSNLSIAGQARFANPSLANLNASGEAHFANPSLGNLNAEGEAHFANPDLDNLSITGVNRFANPSLSNLNSDGEAHFANPSLDNLNDAGENHFANPSLSNLDTEGERKVDSGNANCVISGNLSNSSNGMLDLVSTVPLQINTSNWTTTEGHEYAQEGIYYLDIPSTNVVSATANITLVGGGGGGAASSALGQWTYMAGGGSGGLTQLTVDLTPGERCTITVGAAGDGFTGNPGPGLDAAGNAGGGGSTGGSTTFTQGNNSWVAGGGTGGFAYINGGVTGFGGATPGNGGSSMSGTPGYVGGSTSTDPTQSSTAGGASRWYGWGAGGGARGPINLQGDKGSSGYAYVQVIIQYQENTTITGSDTIVYKVNQEVPLEIKTPNKTTEILYGVNSDNLSSLSNGSYYKYVSAEGSDLITRRYFQYQEPVLTNLQSTGDVWDNGSGELSKFSQTSYVTPTISNTPYNFSGAANSADTWEMNFKVQVGEPKSTNQFITGGDSGVWAPLVGVGTDKKLFFNISSTGSSWDITQGSVGVTELLQGQVYWVRLEFTGESYVLSISTDGENYTQEAIVESSTKIANVNSPNRIGDAANLDAGFNGVIFVKGTYFKINDEVVWNCQQKLPDNTVWAKIGQPYGQFKYNATTDEWEEYNKVYIGTINVTDHQLASYVNTRLYYNEFNLTRNQKDRMFIARQAMPSSTYIGITPGLTGFTWTSPANGWVQGAITGTAGQSYLELVNGEIVSSTASYTGGWARASIPVKTGDTVTFYFNGVIQTLRFTYAEGEI